MVTLMADKAQNAKEMAALMAKAWENTPSVIISTEDYLYALFPIDEKREKWTEASLTFPDLTLEKRELDTKLALEYLIEEITKGMPNYGQVPIVTSKGEFDQAVGRLKDYV